MQTVNPFSWEVVWYLISCITFCQAVNAFESHVLATTCLPFFLSFYKRVHGMHAHININIIYNHIMARRRWWYTIYGYICTKQCLMRRNPYDVPVCRLAPCRPAMPSASTAPGHDTWWWSVVVVVVHFNTHNAEWMCAAVLSSLRVAHKTTHMCAPLDTFVWVYDGKTGR